MAVSTPHNPMGLHGLLHGYFYLFFLTFYTHHFDWNFSYTRSGVGIVKTAAWSLSVTQLNEMLSLLLILKARAPT
jgi:hypothetical protein